MVRPAGWSGCGSSPTVLPSRRGGIIGRLKGATFESKLTAPGMFSGKRPLVRARHSGQSLISASTFRSTTVNLISRRTRCSRAHGSTSERSVPQLSQTSTVETSSTVVVSKFSLVIEFSAALVSRSFLGAFLVSSLSVCDGGMLEFVLVFLVVFSRKMAIRIPSKRHIPLKPHRLLLKSCPLFAASQCQPCSHRTRRAEKHYLHLPLVKPALPSV